MSDHPWAHIPALIDAKVLTPEQANGIIFANRNSLRRAFADLNEAVTEMFKSEDITAAGAQRIYEIVRKAQGEETPDL